FTHQSVACNFLKSEDYGMVGRASQARRKNLQRGKQLREDLRHLTAFEINSRRFINLLLSAKGFILSTSASRGFLGRGMLSRTKLPERNFDKNFGVGFRSTQLLGTHHSIFDLLYPLFKYEHITVKRLGKIP
ncbi:unnamed protein product, partial [Ceratitis capitata]